MLSHSGSSSTAIRGTIGPENVSILPSLVCLLKPGLTTKKRGRGVMVGSGFLWEMALALEVWWRYGQWRSVAAFVALQSTQNKRIENNFIY